MSDITRDDLRAVEVRNIDGEKPEVIYHRLTDEEFDRLVLERIKQIPGVVGLFRQGGLSGAFYLDDEVPPDWYAIPASLVGGRR